MKTHNLVIYHCLRCGQVLHREPDQDNPHCCGTSMAKAAAETIRIDEVPPPVESVQSPAGVNSPIDRVPQKPR